MDDHSRKQIFVDLDLIPLRQQVNAIWLSKVIKSSEALVRKTGITSIFMKEILLRQDEILERWKESKIIKHRGSTFVNNNKKDLVDKIPLTWQIKIIRQYEATKSIADVEKKTGINSMYIRAILEHQDEILKRCQSRGKEEDAVHILLLDWTKRTICKGFQRFQVNDIGSMASILRGRFSVPTFRICADFWEELKEFKLNKSKEKLLASLNLDIYNILKDCESKIDPTTYKKFINILEMQTIKNNYVIDKETKEGDSNILVIEPASNETETVGNFNNNEDLFIEQPIERTDVDLESSNTSECNLEQKKSFAIKTELEKNYEACNNQRIAEFSQSVALKNEEGNLEMFVIKTELEQNYDNPEPTQSVAIQNEEENLFVITEIEQDCENVFTEACNNENIAESTQSVTFQNEDCNQELEKSFAIKTELEHDYEHVCSNENIAESTQLTTFQNEVSNQELQQSFVIKTELEQDYENLFTEACNNEDIAESTQPATFENEVCNQELEKSFVIKTEPEQDYENVFTEACNNDNTAESTQSATFENEELHTNSSALETNPHELIDLLKHRDVSISTQKGNKNKTVEKNNVDIIMKSRKLPMDTYLEQLKQIVQESYEFSKQPNKTSVEDLQLVSDNNSINENLTIKLNSSFETEKVKEYQSKKSNNKNEYKNNMHLAKETVVSESTGDTPYSQINPILTSRLMDRSHNNNKSNETSLEDVHLVSDNNCINVNLPIKPTSSQSKKSNENSECKNNLNLSKEIVLSKDTDDTHKSVLPTPKKNQLITISGATKTKVNQDDEGIYHELVDQLLIEWSKRYRLQRWSKELLRSDILEQANKLKSYLELPRYQCRRKLWCDIMEFKKNANTNITRGELSLDFQKILEECKFTTKTEVFTICYNRIKAAKRKENADQKRAIESNIEDYEDNSCNEIAAWTTSTNVKDLASLTTSTKNPDNKPPLKQSAEIVKVPSDLRIKIEKNCVNPNVISDPADTTYPMENNMDDDCELFFTNNEEEFITVKRNCPNNDPNTSSKQIENYENESGVESYIIDVDDGFVYKNKREPSNKNRNTAMCKVANTEEHEYTHDENSKERFVEVGTEDSEAGESEILEFHNENDSEYCEDQQEECFQINESTNNEDQSEAMTIISIESDDSDIDEQDEVNAAISSQSILKLALQLIGKRNKYYKTRRLSADSKSNLTNSVHESNDAEIENTNTSHINNRKSARLSAKDKSKVGNNRTNSVHESNYSEIAKNTTTIRRKSYKSRRLSAKGKSKVCNNLRNSVHKSNDNEIENSNIRINTNNQSQLEINDLSEKIKYSDKETETNSQNLYGESVCENIIIRKPPNENQNTRVCNEIKNEEELLIDCKIELENSKLTLDKNEIGSECGAENIGSIKEEPNSEIECFEVLEISDVADATNTNDNVNIAMAKIIENTKNSPNSINVADSNKNIDDDIKAAGVSSSQVFRNARRISNFTSSYAKKRKKYLRPYSKKCKRICAETTSKAKVCHKLTSFVGTTNDNADEITNNNDFIDEDEECFTILEIISDEEE